ncbi:MAG: phosphoribosylanthranilate isomerase [Candidatus Rokuibacteriota bacterium]
MTRVKICGVTNVEDARMAVTAGADALGFIFVEDTPRFVTPERVAPIVRALPPFVTPVGVFWDHAAGHITAVVEACGLRAIQLHGDEKPEDCDGYAVPVIKTIKTPPATTIEGLPEYRLGVLARAVPFLRHAAAVLIDSEARWSEGERREPIEWSTVRLMSQGHAGLPVILSGGLTPDNVGRAIDVVRPYAVDVNSGVESSPGRKDPDKVRRFIAAARRA